MISNRFLSLTLLFLATSCYKLHTCQVHKKRFYAKETNIIVLDKGPRGNSFTVKGLNPITGESAIYTDGDGIYNYVYNNLNLGDTLIKTKNNATFLIKKRASNITITYNCANGNYRGGSKLDTIPELTYEKMTVDTLPKSIFR